MWSHSDFWADSVIYIYGYRDASNRVISNNTDWSAFIAVVIGYKDRNQRRDGMVFTAV